MQGEATTRTCLAILGGASTPEMRLEACEVAHSLASAIAPFVAELQAFLYEHFYRHPHLLELSEYARMVLSALFTHYMSDPTRMARWYRAWAAGVGLPRAVCDYLAGMTDRFAKQEFGRLA